MTVLDRLRTRFTGKFCCTMCNCMMSTGFSFCVNINRIYCKRCTIIVKAILEDSGAPSYYYENYTIPSYYNMD